MAKGPQRSNRRTFNQKLGTFEDRRPSPVAPPRKPNPNPDKLEPGELAGPQIVFPPGPAGPSAAELALQQQVIDLASQESKRAQQRFNQQSKLSSEIAGLARDQFEQAQELFPLQQELTELQLQRTKDFLPIEKELLEIQLDQIRRGTKPTEEQLTLINETFNTSFDIGQENIQTQASEALEQLREELAPSRGLRPGDTPIQDRGARIQKEATRQTGQLARNIEQGRAQAKLNFPLAAQQHTASLGQFQQGLLNSSRQFQQQLANQTRNSQAGLGGNLFGTASGLASTPIPTGGGDLALGLTQTLGNQRIQSASVQRPIVGFPGFAPFPPVEPRGGGGGGGMLGFLGDVALGIGMARSSKEFKKDKKPIEGVLSKVEKLPIERWRYKPQFQDDKEHIGPYAEDVKESFGLGDGKTINLMDMVGLNLAATKELSTETKKLSKKVKEISRDDVVGLNLAATK